MTETERDVQAAFVHATCNVLDEKDAEIARLRREMDGLYRTQASMQDDCERQECEIARLRAALGLNPAPDHL